MPGPDKRVKRKKPKYDVIDIINLYAEVVGFDNLVNRYNIPIDMFNSLILTNIPLRKQVYQDFMRENGKYLLSLNKLIDDYINSLPDSEIPDGLAESMAYDKYDGIYLFTKDNFLSVKLPGTNNSFEKLTDIRIIRHSHIKELFDIGIGKIMDIKRVEFTDRRRLEEFIRHSHPFNKWISKYIRNYRARYISFLYDLEYYNRDTDMFEHFIGKTPNYYPALDNTAVKVIIPAFSEIHHLISKLIFANYEIKSLTIYMYMDFTLYKLQYYETYETLIYQRGDGKVIRFDDEPEEEPDE